ncbi:MAG TPA: hypothetical protein VM261_22835 [Kofleriaceae bacterium]|nr:hypothetical protein [Kofleriaceae bacterium]
MRRAAAFAFVLSTFVACSGDPPPTGGDPDGAVATGDASPSGDAGDTPVDAPATPQPGDGVVWTTWDDVQSRSNPAWGTDLTDIANHLPSSYGNQYWDDDPITAGHETSHGIHAHLRVYVHQGNERVNAFYVLGDKAAYVVEPGIRKSAIATHVPVSLRGSRFSLYITGQVAWDDTPLYIWDEWNAYVNGAEVGVDLATHGLWTRGWRDAVMGPIEFNVYALATAKAVQAGDPTYFASNTQFKEFLAWNLRRSMDLFRAGRVLPDFTWEDQDDYYDKLKTSADADALRRFTRQTFGADWTLVVMGY